VNRGDNKKALTCSGTTSNHQLVISDLTGSDNQVWRIENTYNNLFKISNKQYPTAMLLVSSDVTSGKKAEVTISGKGSPFGWNVAEVCELKVEAFKPNLIPGTIEAEDFDKGCPGEAYFDRDEVNADGEYRPDQWVDIEKSMAGGYGINKTGNGEWMSYTINVSKPATYTIALHVTSDSDNSKVHIEYDGADKTGTIPVPNTGRQNWNVVKTNLKMEAGVHVIKLFIDGWGLNLDKMVFEEVK
jgi:alpha-L-fucosidase